MLRKTANLTALLIAVLTLNLSAQDRIAGATLEIEGAESQSGNKALVLAGSAVSLHLSSEFPQSFVAFVYEVEGDLHGFASGLTDESGSLSQDIVVPSHLVSGSLELRGLVFNRGHAVSSNNIHVSFGAGSEPKTDPKTEPTGPRDRYAPMPSDDTWSLADEKKAILKAQSQDDERGRIAPSAGDDTWSLADEKKALKKAQSQTQDGGSERKRPEPIDTAIDVQATADVPSVKNSQNDPNGRSAPTSNGPKLSDEKKALMKKLAQSIDKQDNDG